MAIGVALQIPGALPRQKEWKRNGQAARTLEPDPARGKKQLPTPRHVPGHRELQAHLLSYKGDPAAV
jgi:hypothetical protein